jgi:hypothetical protein
VLAAGGCGAGLIVARAGTQLLPALRPPNLPKLDAIQLRRRGAALRCRRERGDGGPLRLRPALRAAAST